MGRRNRNLDLDTSIGRKLLKGYRPKWQLETVRYSHSILDQLTETNFPSSRLNAAADGETYVTWGEDYFALFDFEAGMNYSGKFLVRAHRRRLMSLAGETMARLHRQLRGFMPAGRHHMGFRDYTGNRWRDVEWHAAKIEELKANSARLTGPDEIAAAAWLIDNSARILDEIARLDAQLSAADLPRLIIHGDYGLHNLLFQKDSSVVTIDFELARIEWRLSDLVSCLSRFRTSGSDELDYDFESIGWFMQAYESVFPLTPEEWRLFSQVWAFYRLQSAVQYWNSYFETNGPVRKLLSAQDAMGQVEWAKQHPDIHTLMMGEATPAQFAGVGERSQV